MLKFICSLLSIFLVAICNNHSAFGHFAKENKFNASSLDSRVVSAFSNLYESQGDIVLNNYSTVYFFNLNTNFPTNSHGTCSFTAMTMLLSFADSYWNDDFVASDFGADSYFAPREYAGYEATFTPESYFSESPGVISEPLSGVATMNSTAYANYVRSNRDNYLQCRLISLAESLFDVDLSSPQNSFALSLYEQTQTLLYYLMYDRCIPGARSFVSGLNGNGWSMSEIIGQVNEYIDSGIPVMMNISSNSFGNHSVVAYDRDDETGEIYVHTGWKDENGNALTHVPLSLLGVQTVDSCVFLSNYFAYEQNIGRHYVSDNGTYSSSYLAYPTHMSLDASMYGAYSPVISWDSLYEERWYNEYNPYIVLEIKTDNNVVLLRKTITSGCSVRLTRSELLSYVYPYVETTFNVSLELKSSWLDFGSRKYIKSFEKPSIHNNVSTITPLDYLNLDEHGSCVSYEGSGSYTTRGTTHNFAVRGENVSLLSEKICLTASSSSRNAFIEYSFFNPIIKLVLQAGVYSGGAGTQNIEATVAEFKYGKYWPIKTITNFSSLDFNLQMIAVNFDRPTSKIKVSLSFDGGYQCNTDDAYLLIGNIALCESTTAQNQDFISPSGGEISYDPYLWNNDGDLILNNCYSYAMNRCRYDGTLIDPGYYGDHNAYVACHRNGTFYDFDNIKALVLSDSRCVDYHEHGFVFTELQNKHQEILGDSYKVALVLDLEEYNEDYHWYRQNPDGTWSHKPGTGEVRDFDFDGNIIYDPENCNRKSSSNVTDEKHGEASHDYSGQIKFFSVKLEGEIS